MDGIINVNKPTGLTSSDVVVRLKRILGTKKVGHAGTLDPAAAGVLPVLVGKGTALSDLMMDKDKEYLAEFTFGILTNTLDGDGTVTRRQEYILDMTALEQAAAAFTGQYDQIPPQVSAIKQGGVPLYKSERRGQTVEVPARTITVYGCDVIRRTGECSALLHIHCSKGTYIRALCRDIAQHMGTVGYVSYLLRSRAGNFYLHEAHTLEEIEFAAATTGVERMITIPEKALAALPSVTLPAWRGKPMCDGLTTIIDDAAAGQMGDIPRGASFRLYAGERFLGLGQEVLVDDVPQIKLMKNLT